MPKFSKKLEDKVNQISSNLHKNIWGVSVPSILKREIALTSEQIKRLKKLHKIQLYNLLQIECYIDTEIMQMEERTPTYSPYRFPEREKLQRRLFNLAAERRKLEIHHEEKLHSLEERLLSLLNKHTQVDILSNGD